MSKSCSEQTKIQIQIADNLTSLLKWTLLNSLNLFNPLQKYFRLLKRHATNGLFTFSCRAENSTVNKLWLIMQLKPCGYSVFVTQGTARCWRCPSVDILCLVLDSYVIFRLPIKKKVKTANKLTSPSVTLRKLSISGLLILTLFNSYSSSVISI